MSEELQDEVLGTHHSSGGRKGAGARDLALFVDALGNAFQPGVVCLFDSVEEFSRRYEDEVAAVEEEVGGGGEAKHEEDDGGEPELDLASLPTPPWTLSEPIVDSRSTFLAHVAPVRSPEQARFCWRRIGGSGRRRTT
uniref:Uncharacterized protein n=1 Tax=Bionectria ochroleuca TaxID=29856 RepID=A0A0B7KDA4_BIOOC